MVVLEPKTTVELTNEPPQAGELVFDTTTSTLKYSVDGIVIKTIADSNLVGPIGINTSNPDRTLEINDANGQVLRLTYADDDGSATNFTDFNIGSDGKLTIDSTGNEILTGAFDSFNIQAHNGTDTGLKLNNTLVTSTAQEINYLAGITTGTATASKALVLDSSKTISGISSISTTGLTLNGTEITASGTQINYNNVTAGTAAVSKTLVLDSSGNITGINSLSATSLTGTLQTAYQPNVTSVDVLDIVDHNGTNAGLSLGGVLLTVTATQLNNLASGGSDFVDVTVSGDITIENHNGIDTGLILGNTLVTSTGAELNYVDVTPGSASSEKALVLDQWGEISGISKLTSTNLRVDGTPQYSLLYNWNNQVSLPSNTWCSVTYSPTLNLYVAVASNNANTNSIVTSTDGYSWTTRTVPTAKAWNYVVWVEELRIFYAVSNATASATNSFVYSSNGTSWTGTPAPTAQNFTYIEYIADKGLLIASAEFAAGSTVAFYYSTNGTSWSNTRASYSYNYNRMTYLPLTNSFVAIKRSAATTNLTIETGTTLVINGKTTGNLYYAAIGENAKTFLSCVYAPEISTFVTVATDLVSAVGSVVYTTNGTTWTSTNASSAASWFKVIWVAEIGRFISISSDSTPSMMTSLDGITWSSFTLPGYIPQLSNIVWIKDTSSLILTALASGETYGIVLSLIAPITSINYIQNQTYTDIYQNIEGNATLNINSGLNGTHRFLYKNSSNVTQEASRINKYGISINTKRDPVASLDIATNIERNSNKALRIKSYNNTNTFDFEVSTVGRVSSVFANTSSNTYYMDHLVHIGQNNGNINSSSTSTGQLVISGGIGVTGNAYIGGTAVVTSSVTTTGVAMSTINNLTGSILYTVYAVDNTSLPIPGTTPNNQFWYMVWSEKDKLLVATTSSATMLYSTTGYSWTSVATGVSRSFRSICYAPEISLYVTIAEDAGTDSGRVMTSTNGTSWSSRTLTSVGVSNWAYVAWSPTLTLFVACAKNGNNTTGLATSPDGINWTQITHPATVSANPSWNKVIWNPTLEHFIVAGYGEVMISEDGTNWTIYNTGLVANVPCTSIAWSPKLSMYVIVSSSSDSWSRTSTDGMTWTGTGKRGNDVIWIEELEYFFLTDGVAWPTGSAGWFSTNGTSWTETTSAPSDSGYTYRSACYSPEHENLYITRTGTSAVNKNVAISRNVAATRFNIGRPNNGAITMYGIDVRTHMRYNSGYNTGHKWYNSINNSLIAENLLAFLDSTGLAIGKVSEPTCKLDIMNSSVAGEIIRLRYNDTNYASVDITSSGGLKIKNLTEEDASSTTNGGVLTISGGTAISKKLYVGDGIYGELQTASQPNITTVGQLSTLDVLGATNFVGVTANGDGVLNPLSIKTRTTATPTNGISTGIEFSLENSANADTIYGTLEISAEDVTSTSEDGALSVKLMSGGTLTERLTLTNDGILGGMLYVQETSDRRVKENIVEADPLDSYEKLMQVQIKDYNFIGMENTQRGFIAQELKEIIPNAVEIVKRGDIDDFHTVKTRDLVCYLIQTVQVMDKKIKMLESKLNDEAFAFVE